MLAARNQENLVHAQQTAAASKPLNQGHRSLNPKTPGPAKTPFGKSRNDENRPFGYNNFKTEGKGIGIKGDGNAFVTPLGPRSRAPLGLKTTNAKAQTFKTPAAAQQPVKPQKTTARPSTGRRSAKSKITAPPSQPVAHDVLTTEEDDDVPDVEYAPPPPIELPDPPMEFPYDQSFPQFQGLNMFRGYHEVYGSPRDENGISIRLKEEHEAEKRYQEEVNRQILKVLDDVPDHPDPDRQVEAMIAAGPKRIRESRIDTVRAKSAATALSQPQLPVAVLKGTVSSAQKKKQPTFSVLGSKKLPETEKSAQIRNAAAAAVSKNTIGFPKAAKPRSIIPKQEQKSAVRSGQTTNIAQRSIDPKVFVQLYGTPPVESEMWFRLLEKERWERELKRDEEDDLAEEVSSTNFFGLNGEDQDDDVFQLSVPD